MKLRHVLLGLIVWCGMVGVGHAANLAWDRNTEGDMSHYRVYACFTKGCAVVQNNAMLQPGTVAQTAVGTVPTWPLPAGKEGTVAVSAVDTSFNESGLSVSVPFDVVSPATPVNPRLQQ
jgi:hypothetical protein